MYEALVGCGFFNTGVSTVFMSGVGSSLGFRSINRPMGCYGSPSYGGLSGCRSYSPPAIAFTPGGTPALQSNSVAFHAVALAPKRFGTKRRIDASPPETEVFGIS
eukprot:EG_transcript_42500